MSWKLEMTRHKQEVQLECCRKTGKSSTSSHGIQVAGHEQVQHFFHPNVIQHCPIVVHGIGSHNFDFCILGPSLKMFNLYTEHHARLTFLLLDKEIAQISPMCTGHQLNILTMQGKKILVKPAPPPTSWNKRQVSACWKWKRLENVQSKYGVWQPLIRPWLHPGMNPQRSALDQEYRGLHAVAAMSNHLFSRSDRIITIHAPFPWHAENQWNLIKHAHICKRTRKRSTNLVIVSYSVPVLPMFLHSNEAYPPKKATSSTFSACKRHRKVRVYPDTQPSSCIFVQLACSLCKTLTIQELKTKVFPIMHTMNWLQ